MEGGDDIGVAGPGIEKVAGASGYDWEIGQSATRQPQDADLNLPIPPLDILQVGVRDRYNEVEALSGWTFDDKLRGDDVVPAAVGGGGFIGCDVLDQAGWTGSPVSTRCAALPTPLADVVGAVGLQGLPDPERPTSGATATSCSAAPAATSSRAAAPTTSSTATGTSASGSVSAPTRTTRPPRSAADRPHGEHPVPADGAGCRDDAAAGGLRRAGRPGQHRGRPASPPARQRADRHRAVLGGLRPTYTITQRHRHHGGPHRSTVPDGIDTLRDIESHPVAGDPVAIAPGCRHDVTARWRESRTITSALPLRRTTAARPSTEFRVRARTGGVATPTWSTVQCIAPHRDQHRGHWADQRHAVHLPGEPRERVRGGRHFRGLGGGHPDGGVTPRQRR